MTLDAATRVLGILVLIVPLLAIQWNLAGSVKRGSSLLASGGASRWRLEIYSIAETAPDALADLAEVPFPVRRVESTRSRQGTGDPEKAWTLPRVELDVEVPEPFADDALNGLFQAGYRVRFVSGNEAVIDAGPTRLRIQAYRFT